MNENGPDSLANGEAGDDLFALQLRIARKADELARQQPQGDDHGLNLHCWLLAEAEVLPQNFPFGSSSNPGRRARR